MSRTGHHVQSVLSPPIRRTGLCAGARFRTSCRNTGSSASGSLPAYHSTPRYSVDSPKNPAGIGLPTADRSTVTSGAARLVIADEMSRGETPPAGGPANTNNPIDIKKHAPRDAS